MKLTSYFFNLIFLFAIPSIKSQTKFDTLWQQWNNNKLHDTIRLQSV